MAAVDESSSDQIDGTIVWDASDDARLTVNAYFLDFEGPSTNYNHVNGPTDYRDNVRMNVIGPAGIRIHGRERQVRVPAGRDQHEGHRDRCVRPA